MKVVKYENLIYNNILKNYQKLNKNIKKEIKKLIHEKYSGIYLIEKLVQYYSYIGNNFLKYYIKNIEKCESIENFLERKVEEYTTKEKYTREDYEQLNFIVKIINAVCENYAQNHITFRYSDEDKYNYFNHKNNVFFEIDKKKERYQKEYALLIMLENDILPYDIIRTLKNYL